MNWWLLTPELVITVAIVALLLLDLFLPANNSRRVIGWIGMVALAAALISTFTLWGTQSELFGGLLVVDGVALFFKALVLIAGLVVMLLSLSYTERIPGQAEYYWLLLAAVLGMMVTAAGTELITIFVGLELLSITFYVLVGFQRDKRFSSETALKYFILGSFSIGLWLYGAALVFGVTGATDLAAIAQAVTAGTPGPVLLIGLLLLIAGFGFKMGLAPFHMWLPDTYEGAPTPVTAFLAVGSKAAGFAVFLRVMATAFIPLQDQWVVLLGLLAVITMSWGNMAALHQQNIKRMLAYSGIAHAGYTMVGIVALSVVGVQAVLFYLLVYLFATLGAFAVVIGVSQRTGSDLIKDYAGLNQRNPFWALSMSFFLLSMAGIPPLAGFFGKLFLFWGAVQQGGWMLTLVVIAGINSAISLFYYVNVIRTMYMTEPEARQPLTASVYVNLPIGLAVVAVLVAAFYFQPVLNGLDITSLISGIR